LVFVMFFLRWGVFCVFLSLCIKKWRGGRGGGGGG